ncbi:MAG: hypothetical protein BroJett033_7940 [Chloroflexota bacterium]|nr:MAG: hypothetical protein BroJett033_7940 [Chloroflexota bacterium]
MGVTRLPNGLETSDLTVSGSVALAGVLSGAVRQPVQELTATGAITVTSGAALLNHNSTVIAATKAAPTAGDVLFVINTSASGTAAHTVTLPTGVTWDGTNRVATLNAPGEALLAIAVSATRFFVVANVGNVAFS